MRLSSSSPQVGTVPSAITFPANQEFVTVPFQTTIIPGTTTVTAFASEYQPASFSVTTQKVGGIPSALKVMVSPSEIPPDSRLNATVIVEAVDIFGSPVELGSSLTVTLSSSSAQTGSIPSSLVIPAGQTFAQTTFTPSFVAGQTEITASASGYTSGTEIVTTIGPIARRLVVSIAPSIIVNSASSSAIVSVQLQDNNSATPAPAPTPVSVVITSSNTSVAQLPGLSSSIVVIPAGKSYTTLQLAGGGASGNATITAAAQGYVKGSANVNAESSSDKPAKLAIYFTPSTLLPDNTTYVNSVVVQMLNSSGFPAINATSSVTVYSRSSNNASMQVSTLPAIIPSGKSYVATNITSTFLPGTAAITTQSVGLSSTTSSLISFGLRPNALNIQFSPDMLFSDGHSYGSIFVSLVDLTTGEPARAPVDTLVSLESNSSLPGVVQDTLMIPAGLTYARASISTSGLPGPELITATTGNYTSASGTIQLIAPAAKKLGLFASPSSIVADNKAYSNLVVELEDLQGNPQKTDVPVVIQLDTPSAQFGSVTSNVTVPTGMTFAPITVFTTNSAGVINVTAFADGFMAANATIKTVLFPMTGQIAATQMKLPAYSQTSVRITATSGGLPLVNATIKWPCREEGHSRRAMSVRMPTVKPPWSSLPVRALATSRSKRRSPRMVTLPQQYPHT